MTNIKKSRVKLGAMSQGTWRATQRLKLLLKQLDQEGAGTRGTRAAIHRSTGLDQGFVSDALNNSPRRGNVTGQTIENVLKTFRSADGRRLDRGFFFNALQRGAEPDYHDYLVSTGPEPEPRSSSKDEYTEEEMLEELRPTPRELSALEKLLRRYTYPRIDAYFKRAIILALRAGRSMQQAVDNAMDKVSERIAAEDDTEK